ncbi:uncharacterized protein V6R79_002322 [Siganus canaliculatus]
MEPSEEAEQEKAASSRCCVSALQHGRELLKTISFSPRIRRLSADECVSSQQEAGRRARRHRRPISAEKRVIFWKPKRQRFTVPPRSRMPPGCLLRAAHCRDKQQQRGEGAHISLQRMFDRAAAKCAERRLNER